MGTAADSLAKVAWAEKHYDALAQSATAYVKGNSDVIRAEVNPDLMRFSFFGRANPIPGDWSLIIGDFAHSARGALDYIVDRLSALPADDQQRRRIQFPIFDTAGEFHARQATCLKGVDPAHLSAFESWQPYNGVGAPLAILREINNYDKHRSVRVVTAINKFGGITVRTVREGVHGPPMLLSGNINLGDQWEFRQIGDGVLTDADSLILTATRRGPSSVGLTVEPQAALNLAFAAGQKHIENLSVLPTLKGVLGRVKDVLAQFP